MDDLTLINNTSVYRNPAPQSPLQGQNVMQPAAVYSKIMLRTIELAESDYTFDGLAVERTMPSNNGSNEIVFKRFLSLAAHTQPLVEGIPPASDQGRMVAIKATTNSYGRVMKFTDKVNWAVVDPLISEYTRQLSLKVPETKDILAQEALLAECQIFYACKKAQDSSDKDTWRPVSGGGVVNHITRMVPDCVPTIDEFRKIVLSMEAAKVRPYQGTNFLVLASSAVIFDLITDKRVKEFMKYENTGKAYSNDMVIDLFSLSFKKAKTIKSDNTYTDADGATKYLYHVPSVTISTSIDSDLSAAYTSKPVNLILPKPIGEMTSSDTYDVVYIDLPSQANATLTNTSSAALSTLFPSSTGIDKLNLHHTFVLGEDCLYRIGVEGHTAPQFIKKELGSAGTEDPLNQRQSIGWKIDSLGYKVPNPDAVVDYISVPTVYSFNMNARPDLKNQFTDYDYGYVSAAGKFFYPEQVIQTVVWDSTNSVNKNVYVVRGTTTEVTPIKMTKLVRPVGTGRIQSTGQVPVVTGTVPTAKWCLASNHAITFMDDQVVLHTDTYHYIKGLAGTSAAKVVELPSTYTGTFPTADGTATESRTAVMEGTPIINELNNDGLDLQ